MNKLRNIVVILIFCICIMLVPLQSKAQEVTSKGVQWLTSVQQSDGAWDNFTGTVVRDTTAVADSMQILDAASPSYLLALQWLATITTLNNDHASRRLFTFSKTNNDISEDLNYLLAGRHQDGGWGLDIDHESSTFNTALALQALKSVNYSDQTIINNAINYLLNHQNTDGGWGFSQGDDSNVYMAALVSSTLQQFPQTTSIATAVSEATVYLIANQNTDGGFGSGASTVYETSYAYMALVGVTTDATVLGNAINYLTSTQLPDGSWEEDPYSTALTLRALFLSENRPSGPGMGTIKGTVTDSSDKLLVGVAITLLSDSQISTQTDPFGKFTLINVPPATQTMVLSLSGYSEQKITSNIVSGQTLDLGTIHLYSAANPPAFATVKGMITDASNGKPLDGVLVTLAPGTISATTGADGAYEIDNVSAGMISTTATKTGYSAASANWNIPAGEIAVFSPALNPLGNESLGVIRVASLTSDSVSYAANTKAVFTSLIENTGLTAVDVVVKGELKDQSGNIVTLIYPDYPVVTVGAGSTATFISNWNTTQLPAGAYTLRLKISEHKVVDPDSPPSPEILLAYRDVSFSIVPSRAVIGALALNPPVTAVDLKIPVNITTTVRNTGNMSLTGTFQVRATLNGADVYSSDIAVSEILVNDLLPLDLGSFIPQSNGTYAITLRPLDTAIICDISATLNVGPHAEATFSASPASAYAGNANIKGNLHLKGVGYLSGLYKDPLVPLVKDAIQKGINWEQPNALAWQRRNDCNGCHVQSQTIAGSENSRGIVEVDDSITDELLNFLLTLQKPDGAFKYNANYDGGIYWIIDQTSLVAWSLTFHHDSTRIKPALVKAADFLLTKQSASGYWSPGYFNFYWLDGGYNSTLTAYNIISLRKAYELTVTSKYKDGVLKAAKYLMTIDYMKNLVATAHILMGLNAALPLLDDPSLQTSVENRIGEIDTYLRSRQAPDGGWPYAYAYKGETLRTALALYALSRKEVKADDEAFVKGARFLISQQAPDGWWKCDGCSSPVLTTTWALISLPIVLDKISGIETDVHLTLPGNIELNSADPVASDSWTSGNNEKGYTWKFPAVNENGVDLVLNETLKDLRIGEARPVAEDAFLQVNLVTDETLISDDFSAQNTAWHIMQGGGTLAWENGEMSAYCAPQTSATALIGDSTWKDYKVEVKVIPKEGDWKAALYIRRSGDSYYAISSSNWLFNLYKVVNGYYSQFTYIVDYATPAYPHTLSLETVGDVIYFYINGKPVYGTRDSSVASGASAIAAWTEYYTPAGHVHFDDFKVTRKTTSPVIIPVEIPTVTGTSPFSLITTVDSPSYSAKQDVKIAVSIVNASDKDQTGTINIAVEDMAGNTVALISNSQITVPGTSTQGYSFSWNTAATLTGQYRVRTAVMNIAGDKAAEEVANFEIVDDGTLQGSVVTDKISYGPNDTAAINSSVINNSTNHLFSDLSAVVSIKNSAGTTLFASTKSIQLLAAGSSLDLTTYWNTSTNPPETYSVTLTVTNASGVVISTASASLVISSDIKPSKLLKGQILVDRQSLLQGEPIVISYSVTNIGNMDLSQIDLSVLTVHVVNLNLYDTLADQTALQMGGTYTNTQQLNTQNYSAKDYLVVLRAGISGVEETLAGTYFRVEGAPSAPSLNSPNHGADVEILTPILIVNNATDPNDDKLSYEFELYTDSGLSNLIASSGATGEGANTTSWQVLAVLQENAAYYWRVRAYDGRLYGEWMSPATFRVNTVNDPPTAPGISSPAEASYVDTTTPVLAVNNATDPDSYNLTYNFVIAQAPDLVNIVASQIGIFEGRGSTAWQAPITLQENKWYYWSSQADDWLITGPWMATAKFFVNTTNEAPSTPVIVTPAEGAEIAATNVSITALNSTDPDSAGITYVFEVDCALTFDSPDKITSGSLPEGTGPTSWLAAGLRDNTWYYVRAKTSDGLAESPWSTVVRFFVNTSNDAPTAPVLGNPSNGAGVNAFNPLLSVYNSSDADGDVLTYEFEVYGDASLSNLVSAASYIQENPQVTAWAVTTLLTENTTYFWRTRAFDGQLYGPWMLVASFMVNTANDAPTAPTLYSPAMGNSLDTLNPVLSVHNAVDPDSDSLTYDFEIYTQGVLTTSVKGVPQDMSGITSTALNALSDNKTYQWRARAYDGDRYGAWMDMATFSIHLPSKNITSTIDFDPNTLNQKSKGNWVTVYIELPAGYNVADIVISSVRLEGTIPAEPWPYSLSDYDHDGIPDLMVKFNRDAVINLLPNGDTITVKVTGTAGVTTFEGVDTIRVIYY